MAKLIKEKTEKGRLHIDTPLMGESLVSKEFLKRTEAKEEEQRQEIPRSFKELNKAKENIIARINDNNLRITARRERVRLLKEKIEMIFNHWKIVMKHPGASLSDERAAKIRTRLKEGFTYDQCIAAIDGCAGSTYHMGGNDTGTIYDSIDLIFRNTSKTEGFINRNKRKVEMISVQQYQYLLSIYKKEVIQKVLFQHMNMQFYTINIGWIINHSKSGNQNRILLMIFFTIIYQFASVANYITKA